MISSLSRSPASIATTALIILSLLIQGTWPARTDPDPPGGRGINCHGSSQCYFTTVSSSNILSALNVTATTGSPSNSDPPLPGGPLNDLELYFSGEHILCAKNNRHLVGSICVFLQGQDVPVGGVPGYLIKIRIQELVAHGCKFCGSVPLSGDNRPEAQGLLTSNYVIDQSCQGVCSQPRRRTFVGNRSDITGTVAAEGAG
ncbi:MAG: hypothetical protein Q9220_003981 [cf. Caloplaca sp. 1 TL-2023]